MQIKEVENAFEGVLDAMGFDWKNDPNMDRTPARLAKMYTKELFKGVHEPRPNLAEFPNTEGLDELFAVGPIPVRSVCSHHFAPVQGNAWIGVIPGETLLGLSKYSRLVDWVMSKPTLQEDVCCQLADTLEKLIKPVGIAVVIRASHACMTMRGVKNENSVMTTSVMRGALREEPAARAEFLATIAGMGY